MKYRLMSWHLAILFMLVLAAPRTTHAQYNWTEDPNNPLLNDGFRLIEPSVLYDPASGRYDLWYTDGYFVTRASSTDGRNWTPMGATQDLTALFGIRFCHGVEIVKIGSTYYMYCSCLNYDVATAYIGLATSTDGNTWTKHPSNPALTPGLSGSWESAIVMYPRIEKRDAVYFMLYEGNTTVGANGANARIGVATSPDGVHWTKSSTNPVIEPGNMGSNTSGVVPTGLTYSNGLFYLILSRINDPYEVSENLATSTDGISWTYFEGNPILKTGNPGTWNYGAIQGGTLRCIQGKYKFWYCGSDEKPGGEFMSWRLGLATSDGPAQGIPVSLPEIAATPGSTLEVPLTVGPLTGRGILSYQFTLTFNDPDSILNFGSGIVTEGTLTDSKDWWGGLVNISQSNQVTVGGYRATPAEGEGELLRLKLHILSTALPGQSSRLSFKSFTFNSGDPSVSTTDGIVTIHGRTCGDADENGQVDAYDAALTLREALGPMSPPPPPLTAVGRLNADVNLDGKLLAYDAALILRDALGLAMPESTVTCFGTEGQPSTRLHLAMSGKLVKVENGIDGTTVQLKLTGVPPGVQVFSYSFELTASANTDDTLSFTLPRLPEGYLATVNRLGSGRFSVGIISPYGLEVQDIPLTVSARRASSLNDISFNHLYLNDAPSTTITLTNITTAIESPTATSVRAKTYDLIGVYPNPFNPSTRVVFQTEGSAPVHLAVYNAQGIRIKTLVQESLTAGRHEISWDGTNDAGQVVASGQYFCRMLAGSVVRTMPMLLLK